MSTDSLWADQRAVEGMPIRLVVAITVGVAAAGLLLPLPDMVEQSTETTVTAQPDSQQLVVNSSVPSQDVTISVVTAEGEPVTDATVIVSERSLPVVDDPAVFETGPDSNEVEISIGKEDRHDIEVDFRETQARGTLDLDVKIPGGNEYEVGDSPEITVIRE